MNELVLPEGSDLCGQCGEALDAEARFCGACGARLGSWKDAVLEPPRRARQRAQAARFWRRQSLWVAGFVLALVLLGIGLAFVGDGFPPPAAGDPDGAGVPADWAEYGLPNPESVPVSPVGAADARATRAFLVGEGAALLAFHKVSVALLEVAFEHSQAAAVRCQELVEQSIDPITAYPTELLALSAEIPHAGTASLWGNDIAAKWDLLSTCLGNADIDGIQRLQTEAAFSHVLVERQLAQLSLADDVEGWR